MREYRRKRDYERELARLRKDGWRVVSVLERPGSRPRLDRLIGGLYSTVFPPPPERLVTYSWEGRGARPPRPVPWLAPERRRRRIRRLWWVLVVVLLVALLAYGLLGFFVDVPHL